MADTKARSVLQPEQQTPGDSWVASLERKAEQDKRSEPWKAYATKLGDQSSSQGKWEQGEHGVHWVDVRHEGPETS